LDLVIFGQYRYKMLERRETMEYMINLLQNSQQYVLYCFVGLIILVLILSIVVVSLHLRVNGLQNRYKRMMQGMEGVNIEQMLVGHIDEVKNAVVTVERLKGETKRLENTVQSCIQRVGIVRFNAFEDTGSDLSFSLALLDERNNGIVMSNLYGRSESRVYAKPVVNLQSTYVLSAEEQKAINLAKESAASAVFPNSSATATSRIASKTADNNGMLTAEEKDLLGRRSRK
jgi:hypothetical protein